MTALPWARPLSGRDPGEEGRSATPLELFFDLCYVVAVAAAAAGLHHDLAHGHVADGVVTFALVFFGIWWAWVNYSWFASAYDTGDVRFRLVTFVLMTGVLVLAAGVPRVFEHDDTDLLVAGYVIMRVALVPMWLRVARDHPAVRRCALRYAAGITLLQVLWIARVLWFGHDLIGLVSFAGFALLEMAVPWLAERSVENGTPWHAEHIAERYQLFTIIVLGEVILATTQAISASLDAHGFSTDLLMVVVGGLLLVLGLWWLYFKRSMLGSLGERTAFFFGYVHYFVLGAVAAVGAALAAVVDVVQHEAHGLGSREAALVLATAVTVYLLAIGAIHSFAEQRRHAFLASATVGAGVYAAVLVGTAVSHDIGLSVLLAGLVIAGAVVEYQVREREPVSG